MGEEYTGKGWQVGVEGEDGGGDTCKSVGGIVVSIALET